MGGGGRGAPPCKQKHYKHRGRRVALQHCQIGVSQIAIVGVTTEGKFCKTKQSKRKIDIVICNDITVFCFCFRRLRASLFNITRIHYWQLIGTGILTYVERRGQEELFL